MSEAEIKVTATSQRPKANDVRAVQEKLFLRQKQYLSVFPKENEFAKAVLEDIARFCRAEESCFNADPRIHAMLEGRREVYLRIRDHLNLSSQDLWAKYS